MIGTTIEQYRIVEELGRGGVGVVYKAEDSRLQRSVAIKFLRETADSASDAMKRFRQEARALSSLNHPNICTIHDIGEYDGQLFIVMELFEGATLDRHFAKNSLGVSQLMAAGAPVGDILGGGAFENGPSSTSGRRLSVDDVFAIAIQIADALDAAHTAGVIHRDVKPANIAINRRLHAKLLDFGLAKLVPFATQNTLTTADRTLLTNEGTQLGTIAYMSPEQIEGGTVDARTDLFSFGTVLYELATGREPFAGRTAGSTVANILKDEPPVMDSSPMPIPAGLERIIRTCLNKKRNDRYGSAAALLDDLQQTRSGAGLRAPSPQSQRDSAVPTPALSGRIRLSRSGARGLFVFMQLGYLAMYAATLNYMDETVLFLERAFVVPEGVGGLLTVGLAMTGIAVRLYLISSVSLDDTEIGNQFRRLFPFLVVLDVIWATSPLLVFTQIGGFALAGVAGLVYAPFSQRTLMQAAYS
jgi:serine/threonine protein kinase